MKYIKEVSLTIYEILFRVDEPLHHQSNAMMLIEIKICWNKMCLTLPLKVLSDNKVLKKC